MTQKDVKKDFDNIPSLSPTEQRIYSQLYSQRVITTEDVKGIVGESHKSANYTNNLKRKGYLQKIRKGVYAIVPPNLVGEEFKPDKFLIAGNLKDDYYLAYHSALELHGVAQSAYNTVWISCENPSEPFSYQEINYRFVTSKHDFGLTQTQRQNNSLRVSDREKTLLDCIRKPKYAGGWEELLKSIESFPAVTSKRLLSYLEKFSEQGLYQKTGFILENIGLPVSQEIIAELKSHGGERTYYLDKNKRSHYVSQWNLMVPDNWEEMFYHG